MKYIIASLIAVAMAGAGASTALAAPFNATNNPNIVANYDSGIHGIVGDSNVNEGSDVVMRAGNSGNFQQTFQQWFMDGTAGVHSVWMVSKDGSCPDDWYKIENINTNSDNFWGDYLQTGETYCVHNNEFGNQAD